MSNINLTAEELEDMLDRAARRGAKHALSSIGLFTVIHTAPAMNVRTVTVATFIVVFQNALRVSRQASIGLLDGDAHRDITEMRSLIEAWRDTRKAFWNTTIKVATVTVLTFIAGAVWMTVNK